MYVIKHQQNLLLFEKRGIPLNVQNLRCFDSHAVHRFFDVTIRIELNPINRKPFIRQILNNRPCQCRFANSWHASKVDWSVLFKGKTNRLCLASTTMNVRVFRNLSIHILRGLCARFGCIFCIFCEHLSTVLGDVADFPFPTSRAKNMGLSRVDEVLLFERTHWLKQGRTDDANTICNPFQRNAAWNVPSGFKRCRMLIQPSQNTQHCWGYHRNS